MSFISFSLYAAPQTATQSVEMRSEYYMDQSQTFFRQGASGEISSIAVHTQGKMSILKSGNEVLGDQYSLSKPLQLGWSVSDRYSSS